MRGQPPNRQRNPGTISYEQLLGSHAWQRLPATVRQRFSNLHAQTYAGVMHTVWLSAAGWLLAQCLRIIGGPLALHRQHNVPCEVAVYPARAGGMVWDRRYAFRGGRRNRVRSTKRFDAKRGLLEVVGGGFGMCLALSVEDDALVFLSTEFFWQWRRLRLRLPSWLGPGHTRVVHRDLGHGQFRFTLDVRHPVLGQTVYQDGVFHDAQDT